MLPQVDGRSVGAALACRRCQTGQSRRRRQTGDRGFRPKGWNFLSRRAVTRKAVSEAPHLHIDNANAYRGRCKQWIRRFNGVATKNLPNFLGWRRALEARGGRLNPPNWIKGAIGSRLYQQITLQEAVFEERFVKS